MFGLFRKKPSCSVQDTVWMNTAAGMRAAQRWLEDQPSGSIVTWFRDDAEYLRKAFSENLHSRIVAADFLHVVTGPLVFWNHYPLRATEEALAERLQLKEMLVYSALDSPFFLAIGGERMVVLMQKLGMTEEEPISHSMVSSSIRKAQDKLAARAGNEMLASGAAEWFRLNAAE